MKNILVTCDLLIHEPISMQALVDIPKDTEIDLSRACSIKA